MSSSSLAWQTPSTFPVLKNQQVHVWCASLEYTDNQLNDFFALLNDEEQARAQRFHFLKDRHHFVAARGILKKLLGTYLKLAPQSLNFSYSAFGKPFLKEHPSLQFNLSHSNQMTLIAITLNYAVGIDIESMHRICDMDLIAQRYFSAREYEILKNLSNTEKTQTFYNGWTRKEAFLKAHGQGLSYSLDKVEVTMHPNETVKFLALHDAQENISEWSLYELAPLTQYASALVVKNFSEKLELKLFKFQ